MISRNLKKIFPRTLRYFSEADVPVYERPYNPLKYEIPGDNLKQSTGYALLDVEPMPRARIMKLGYFMLDKVKQAPEDSTLRLWFEERAKWVMEITDQTESTKELEKKLGDDIIEVFIQDFHQELQDLDTYIKFEVWKDIDLSTEEEKMEFAARNASRLNNKYGHFGRKNRDKLEFLEAEADRLNNARRLK